MVKRRRLKKRKSSLLLRTSSLRLRKKPKRRIKVRYIYILCNHCWEMKTHLRKRKKCGCYHSYAYNHCSAYRPISCGCGCCFPPKYKEYEAHLPNCPQEVAKGVASVNQSFSPGVTTGLINLFLPIFLNTGDATAFNESNNNGYSNTA